MCILEMDGIVREVLAVMSTHRSCVGKAAIGEGLISLIGEVVVARKVVMGCGSVIECDGEVVIRRWAGARKCSQRWVACRKSKQPKVKDGRRNAIVACCFEEDGGHTTKEFS